MFKNKTASTEPICNTKDDSKVIFKQPTTEPSCLPSEEGYVKSESISSCSPIPNCETNGKIFDQEVIIVERGKDGLSAYQVAVKNGFVGTEAEWLESLVGEGIVPGGTTGQALVKASDDDYDTEWIDFPSSETVSDVTFDVTVGAINAGDAVPSGTDIQELVELLGSKTFDPTFVNPTFGLINNAGLRVVGSSSNFTLTFNFNRGSILGAKVLGVWNPTEVQNPRAGAATSYTLNGVTQAGNSLVVSGYTVIQGNNTFTGTVTYDTGAQPLNSKDESFGAPFIGGTSAVQSTTFEGVYPLFATTVNITTATQQALASMLTATNIQITLVAESGGNKQFFEIPDAWLATRPLVSVQYFNALSGQFDTTNKIADFAVTSVTETVEGNSIGYKRYTYTGADRGSLLIRLLF